MTTDAGEIVERRCPACGGRGWRLDLDEPCSCNTADQASKQARLAALAEEHCYITSTDGCCHCGDSECDGIGCIAGLDPNDERDYEAICDLHHLLQQGQAWRAMQTLRLAGAAPLDALVLAASELARATNNPDWPPHIGSEVARP